jgi:hypothetical protein
VNVIGKEAIQNGQNALWEFGGEEHHQQDQLFLGGNYFEDWANQLDAV